MQKFHSLVCSAEYVCFRVCGYAYVYWKLVGKCVFVNETVQGEFVSMKESVCVIPITMSIEVVWK